MKHSIKPAIGNITSRIIERPAFVPEGGLNGTTIDIVGSCELVNAEIVFVQLNQRTYCCRAGWSSGGAKELGEDSAVRGHCR